MKRILLTLLGVIVVVGALAGAGFAGYRIGFQQGAQLSANGEIPRPGRPDHLDPFHGFDRGFDRPFNHGFPNRGFQMMHHGGFGFFGPFMFLGQIAIWALIILGIYWLFTRSGWRITRTQQTVQNTTPTGGTVTKTEEQETQNE